MEFFKLIGPTSAFLALSSAPMAAPAPPLYADQTSVAELGIGYNCVSEAAAEYALATQETAAAIADAAWLKCRQIFVNVATAVSMKQPGWKIGGPGYDALMGTAEQEAKERATVAAFDARVPAPHSKELKWALTVWTTRVGKTAAQSPLGFSIGMRPTALGSFRTEKECQAASERVNTRQLPGQKTASLCTKNPFFPK